MSNVVNDWSVRRLREIVVDQQFAIVDGPFGTQLHADEYVADGVPVVRVTNTSYSGNFRDAELAFITEHKADTLRRSEVLPRDIIVAKTGATIGKLAMFPADLVRGIIASSCLKLTVDSNKANPKFVFYLLCSTEGQKKILEVAGGSTRTTINCGPFGSIQFRFPNSISEQACVAEVLSAVDECIKQTEALIAKMQQIKAGLMHDLFTQGIMPNGQLRAPREEAPRLYKESPLGWIPKQWSWQTINELLAKSAWPMRSGPFGSSLLKSQLVKDGVPLLGIDNVFHERFEPTYKRFVTNRKFFELSRYAVFPWDVIITIMGTVGRCCVVPNDIGRALSSKHLWTMTFDRDRVLPELVCWQLNYAPWVKSWFARGSQGAVMDAIQSSTLRTLSLPTPPIEEQEQIRERYSCFSQSIAAEDEKLANLYLIKSGLMHDLLAGRVRLPEALLKKAAASA